MADLSNIQPCNWLEYFPERPYFTFISQDKEVIMEVYNCRRICSPNELGFFRVTTDVLSAFKFSMLGARSKLMRHYEETLGAHFIGGQRMAIGSEAAAKLFRQYFKSK
jgi:hypothetical protein